MLKRLFVFICVAYQVQCMELGIDKKHPISLIINTTIDGSLAPATLSGLSFQSNKIDLLGVNPGSIDRSWTKDGNRYNPATLLQALKDEQIDEYPLEWHKKIQHIDPNTQLNIIVVNACGNQQPVLVSQKMKQRLLSYLLHDVTRCNRDSFDLCKNVILKKSQKKDQINQYESLVRYIDCVDSADCIPGDMLGLYKVTPLDDNGNLVLLTPRRYAIALGSALFLSKSKKSRKLYVCSAQPVKDHVYVKIDPSIGKRNDFINNPFRPIVIHSIGMHIHPYKKALIPIHGKMYHASFVAFLSGFHCKQAEIRRAYITAGTIDKHDYQSSEELQKLLLDGSIRMYPLCDHRRLNYIVGDELLTICLHISKDRIIPINLPYSFTKKLLLYLAHDSEDTTKQCFDFCIKICFNSYEQNGLSKRETAYKKRWKFVKEEDLKPGDAVALGAGRASKHFVIALGHGIYLSKLGNGGRLCVTDMKSIMQGYHCKNFALMERDITRYERFWKNYNASFKKTPVRFSY